MSQNNLKAFAEVTVVALVLFAVPIGYYYGRDSILRAQTNMYNRLFLIKEKDLLRMKEIKQKHEEQDKKEEEKEGKTHFTSLLLFTLISVGQAQREERVSFEGVVACNTSDQCGSAFECVQSECFPSQYIEPKCFMHRQCKSACCSLSKCEEADYCAQTNPHMVVIIVSLMIACLIMVIVILFIYDCIVKRRSKRQSKSFRKTFFTSGGMTTSTRFTEYGFNEEDEAEVYEAKDDKLNQEFRSFLNNHNASRSESFASDSSLSFKQLTTNNLPLTQIDLFSQSPSKFTSSPDHLRESSATLNNKLFDSTYQNMMTKQISKQQTQKMTFKLKNKLDRTTQGVSFKTNPVFKGGRKRKIHCKNYLPNALLPFDHNGKDNRYEGLLGGKSEKKSKNNDIMFTE